MLGRNNRVLVWLIGASFCLSFLGLWLGHTSILHLHEGPDHLFLHSLRKSNLPRLSWKPVLQEIQNRTIAAKQLCNEINATSRHQQRLLGWNDVHDIPQNCNYPPQQECLLSQYSILIFFSETSNLRTLFVNLLRCLTLANVSSIHVVMLWNNTSKDAKKALEEDIKYGRRILSWHSDVNHQVVLSFNGTLPHFRSASRPVLLLDGNVAFAGNRQGLQFGLDVWKRHANSIVSSHAWPLIKMKSTKEESAVTRRQQNYHNEIFVSLCRDESLRVFDKDGNAQSTVHLPDLSGMWVHSDFLCLLRQSPLLTNGRQPHEFKLSLLMWLMQVSRPTLQLYPLRLPANRLDSNSSSTFLLEGDSELALATRLMREFGGMPATTAVKWCVESTIGKPLPCTATGLVVEDACEYSR